MDIFRASERLMGMDDATWARHANPISVWTRVAILPALAFAIWSRVWIGWWALIPIVLIVAFTFVNPRLFPPPASTDNWASKGTFGERVFLARRAHPIPRHHERMGLILSAASGLFVILLTYGLIVLDACATVFGTIGTLAAKLWFVDRMVWLFDDMKDTTPAYRGWLR
ncbi:hypothetical protein FP2506_18269 [Fulvimarina pelagi HTCC2506]|uniref:Transmembrane protein n=1 Tax=Fulvimarina pelagi HTCC2506 TaxID=314231 RepID=Q0G0X9_9HYPH|nr:DUF6653 family protein [Fulvimarina pelagi]EAU40860.1 hypothetical protein FP2506_18269 [Fulvimarina pelagi HTCC2506]